MNWDLVLNEYLAWSIGAIAFFSFLGVAAWTTAQRKEREAFYKADAIKKLAEMKGPVDEAVLRLLREALESFAEPVKPVGPQASKEYYYSQMMAKMAEAQGGAGAESVMQMLREREMRGRERQREGLKLAGLILIAVATGLFIFLRNLVIDQPVYLVSLIPGLIGVVFFMHAFVFSPRA